MGLANIGIPSLILIIVLALIIFGPKRLPDIGKAAGQTLQEFKSATNDLINDSNEEIMDDRERKVKSTDEKS